MYLIFFRWTFVETLEVLKLFIDDRAPSGPTAEASEIRGNGTDAEREDETATGDNNDKS